MSMCEIFSGLWVNEYGSKLKLQVDEKGNITGEFFTHVGRRETKDEWQDKWFKVTGFVNGSLISFIINYNTTNALCCHVGSLENIAGELQLKLKGHFIRDVPKDQKWQQTIATSSLFNKSSTVI